MRCSVSPAFDLNVDENKQLKEVVKEVFLSKPRGRTREDVRRKNPTGKKSSCPFLR